ncbi:hypothetical protein LDVICp194 [lymphocystis disease virus-China]|uniref:Uncharacterized protein n=1 Tax=lymphocystis disease virus-China TaxID=256729 RepID=Q677S0_9VIRU|nr:hypothetical protein LDVICp194 [lymphocystis disease virus-China]AAU11037.1 hypothetical protein [lymphocystis disease virus-China]
MHQALNNHLKVHILKNILKNHGYQKDQMVHFLILNDNYVF